MRRALTAVFAALVAVAPLAGCGAAAGIDGDLTDDWAVPPPAGPFVPAAGVCQVADFTDVVTLAAYEPVECAVAHRVETVHVGVFRAGRGGPPAADSAELRSAFADCDAQASGYVGDDWRAGRLRLAVALPSPVGWASGARWYRCDLVEVDTVEAGAKVVSRTGSLRDTLKAPASPLRLGCHRTAADAGRGPQALVPVACGTRHDAEFVGVWKAPDKPYPARDADWIPLYAGCRSVLARYVGVPDDDDLRFRSGVVVRPPGAGRWRVGDRGVRCYLWLSDRTVTASLRGAGPAGLPVRTK
ncbi:septum formation family protein [Micromonospora olivasterospora]|uniref:Putative regulator of septum formation n=1 Tax=Micromonospora olivasterospora TaxID=1880 RepID=A0A562I7T4_MICOL|nr:septum formation family protein [Micromonospora olivasterospora]TWH66962.1 putative regulator of septum formation [Micromonospora olivasterospora]